EEGARSSSAVNRHDRGLFQTCRNGGGGGSAIAVGPHPGVGQARAAGTLFLWTASPAAAFGGSLSWQSRRRIPLRHAQQREGQRRHSHQNDKERAPPPRGRAGQAGARLPHWQK